MKKLSNTIWELVSRHISIYEEMESSSMCLAKFSRQLDFLEFWVSSESFLSNNPFMDYEWSPIYVRDNPNFQPTKYDNVLATYSPKSIELVYNSPKGYASVKILQWYKCKNQHKEGRKISIYGKWLRLYYNGLLPWLSDYVSIYAWEMIRADLCWDTKDKVPAGVIDLQCVNTRPEDKNRTYKMFGNGDLTARIYDKTLDLKKDKFIHLRLYPQWYKNWCWRVEFVFKWRYARSLSAKERLEQCPTDWTINDYAYSNRDKKLTNIYTMYNSSIQLIEDFAITEEDKFNVLLYIKDKVDSKISKFRNNKIISASKLKDLN